MNERQDKHTGSRKPDTNRDARTHRNLSDVDDGGSPQSANASGDGTSRTGNRKPQGSGQRARTSRQDQISGRQSSNARSDLNAIQDEDIADGAAQRNTTPAGAAGSRRTNQRESRDDGQTLRSDRPRTSATQADQPTAGTSRRSTQASSGSLHGGFDSTSARANPREDVTRPRSDDLRRRTRIIDGDKRPKRGLLSRLNPFSRH